MFSFLKRRKKLKTNPFQVAAFLAMATSKYSGNVDTSIDNFLQSNPKFSGLRTRMLDETQWVILACGIIALGMSDGVPLSREVLQQLRVFYSQLHAHNGGKTMFTGDYIDKLNSKLEAYLVRFNRRLVLSFLEIQPFEALVPRATEDFANETMEYITGESRCTKIMDAEEIQERTRPEDELERYIYGIICQFMPKFAEQLGEFEMVS